tara:strand:+ start:7054 stop:7584 length:531 start_codon:yes stop_codon:yes gene_type:complete
MDLSFITNQKLSTKINIKPDELNQNINEIIYYKLKSMNEGLCINEGYIIKNSIEIINKSMGHIVNLNNKSYIQYNVNYKAILLSPKENDVINCYIDNINKLGIVAYIKLSELLESIDIDIDKINDTFNNSPVVIIIPEINIDDITKYNNNDNINVKINAIRIKYNSDKIQLIATLV